MRINQNVMALNAYRNLSSTSVQMGKSLEKLSSGFRINRAADDAAGLVISNRLRAQISGLRVASRNAQDGISVVQTAESALNEVQSMLNRMRDLAVQSANTGALDSEATGAAQAEITELLAEVDRIAGATKFGTQQLLDGSFDGTFQVGAQVDAAEQIQVTIAAVDSAALSIDDIDVADDAGAAQVAIDAAIDTISSLRGDLGAKQNRFESTIANLDTVVENLSASESRIRDADMALEMTTFTRNQILVQAGTAMLAQANSVPQNVLQLLRG
jgi:flagellin